FLVVVEDHRVSEVIIARLTPPARRAYRPPHAKARGYGGNSGRAGRVRSRSAGFLIGRAGAGGTTGQVRAPAQAHGWRRASLRGRGNLRVKASANDVPVMDAPAKMTYLDVLQIGSASGDGATEIKERFENFQVSGEGQMGEMMKQMMGPMGKIVVTTRVKPDGTVVSTKTDGAEGEMMRDMARRMGRAK